MADGREEREERERRLEQEKRDNHEDRVDRGAIDSQHLHGSDRLIHRLMGKALKMLDRPKSLLLVIGEEADSPSLRRFDQTDAGVVSACPDPQQVHRFAALECLAHRSDGALREHAVRMEAGERAGHAHGSVGQCECTIAQELEARACPRGAVGHAGNTNTLLKDQSGVPTH